MKFSTCVKVGAGFYLGYNFMKCSDEILCALIKRLRKCNKLEETQ